MFKFLNLKPETFGLDINDSSFKVIKIRKKRGFLQPVSYNEKKLASGIIKDGIIKDENAFVKNIKDMLAGVEGEKLRTKYVVASLPEEKTFSQVIQMPKMEKEELKSAVAFEAENYIPLPAGQMYLDFQVIDPIVDHLDHLDVLIVAIEKTIVDSYVSCLKKAGLIPLAFEAETQAISRALVKGEKSLVPLVLIDFGADSTDLIVFAGRSVRFTCSIPVSSQQITEAISEELGIGLKEAEKVKLKYGFRKEKSDSKSVAVSKITGSVLDKLVVEIKKYLDFYLDHDFHQHLPQKTAIEKVILSGGGADLKGIDEFLKLKLKIPVEFGNPWINFPSGLKKFALLEVQKKSLSFVTALGLALREPDPEING